MEENNRPRTVKVEFFGPFREFGSGMDLVVEGDLTFEQLLDRLVQELGEAFRGRALKRNTTYILNNKVIRRKGLSELRISPGDRMAFALVLGGG